MTMERAHPHSVSVRQSRAAGFTWFAAIVGGWVVFSAQRLRFALVTCCAIGWSLACSPWRRKG